MKQRLTLRTRMKTSTRVVIAAVSCLVIFLGFFFFFNLSAPPETRASANIYALISGNWNNPLIWSTGTVPTAADNVTISPLGLNITVNVNTAATCASLTITGNTRSATLNIEDAQSLVVTGDVTLNGGNNAARVATLSVTGNGAGTEGTLTVQGNLNIYGNGSSANAVISTTGSSTVNLAGAINLPAAPNNHGTISASAASTFNFNGTATQILKLTGNGASSIAYGNILVNNTVGVQLEAAVTAALVAGNIRVQTGKLYSNGFTVTMAAGKTFQLDNSTTYITTTAGVTGGLPLGSALHSFGTTSTVEFAGAAQTVPALLSGQSYGNLAVTAAGTKTLAASVSVNTTLFISAGTLSLNGYTLTLNSSSQTAIQRAGGGIQSENTANTSIIAWKVGAATGTFTIPFTTAAGSYIPVIFSITTAGVGASGTLSFSTYPTAADNTPYPSSPIVVSHVSSLGGLNNSANTVDRFWEIDDSGYSVKPVISLTFTATSAEVGTISDLVAQRWNSTTNYWEAALPNQVATTVSAMVPGVNKYGVYTLTQKLNPLPVELIAFNGKAENHGVLLNWTTASENNNDYFSVEKSQDGRTFTELGRKKGTNTASKVSYSYTDPSKLSGEAYYRLRQVDFNGVFSYSPVILVKDGSASLSEGLVIDQVFPNPFRENLAVSFTTPSSGPVDIELHDLSGKLLHKERHEYDSGANHFQLAQDDKLKKGVYLLVFRHNNTITSKKVVKL
jgi:hypothetical protein